MFEDIKKEYSTTTTTLFNFFIYNLQECLLPLLVTKLIEAGARVIFSHKKEPNQVYGTASAQIFLNYFSVKNGGSLHKKTMNFQLKKAWYNQSNI